MVGIFPVASRRKVAAIVAACLPVVALSSPFALADDLKDKQKQVKRQIDHAQGELHESSGKFRAAMAALERAQAKLDVAQTKLAGTRKELAAAQARDLQMQKKLNTAIAELEQARIELAAGERRVLRQEEALGELISEIYAQGDPELMSLAGLLEAGSLSDVTRILAANESFTDYENGILHDYEAAVDALAAIEAKVEEKKDEIAVQREAAAQNLVLKKKLEKEAAAQTAEVQKLVDSKGSAMQAAKAAKAHDAAILASLERQENKIAEQLRARAAAAAGSGGSRGGYLSYPVNGSVTSPYGYRTHPIYGYYGLHNGVDFGAGCGSALYATAGGRVLTRSYDSVYGNYLIIDHGGVAGVNVASRYNHATSYTVSTGEHVDRGEVIGYVGSTGWSTGCHLHFSVLENGRYVDPMKWL